MNPGKGVNKCSCGGGLNPVLPQKYTDKQQIREKYKMIHICGICNNVYGEKIEEDLIVSINHEIEKY